MPVLCWVIFFPFSFSCPRFTAHKQGFFPLQSHPGLCRLTWLSRPGRKTWRRRTWARCHRWLRRTPSPTSNRPPGMVSCPRRSTAWPSHSPSRLGTTSGPWWGTDLQYPEAGHRRWRYFSSWCSGSTCWRQQRAPPRRVWGWPQPRIWPWLARSRWRSPRSGRRRAHTGCRGGGRAPSDSGHTGPALGGGAWTRGDSSHWWWQGHRASWES